MEAPARPTTLWKPVALPVEHGGWGFLGEPIVLGLVLAPGTAGVCLALAALAAFLARHPLRLWLSDRRKGARYPRTTLAARFVLGYAALALLMLVAASAVAEAPFWPALAVATPVGLVALAGDARGWGRDALAEVAGAVTLGASVTAIALAGGAASAFAWTAWALLALRALTSVLYVRARIRLDRGLAAGPGLVLAAHVLALAAAILLARTGWAPWLGAGAFVLLLARAAYGVSAQRPRLRPQAVGYQELGYGLATLTLLAVGYRLGP